jgi:CRP-like cAMP-binding protein
MGPDLVLPQELNPPLAVCLPEGGDPMAIQTAVENQLEPFFDRIRLHDELASDEREAIVQAARERLTFANGQDLVSEGDRPMRSMLLTRGMACRYRVRPSGERQLMAMHLPGDFVDLHSFLIKEMDHAVGALTECEIVSFPHELLVKLTERYPHLTRILWLLTLVDGARHREWLVGLGLLSAQQRVAHLFCEIYRRLEVVGLARDLRFHLPITQVALADAVGISAVHVNRVLQELRQRRLIAWDGGMATVHDWQALVAMAEFDERYLHFVREHR